ncbi:MAG: twin-arginine translocation signal domain-containing protein [Kiritimatiellia bacterium]
MLNRRSFLRTASLAGLGCGLTGCQSTVSEDRGYADSVAGMRPN